MQMQPQQSSVLPSSIRLWIDPVPRTGYQNMAADELLSRRGEAWLRIYGWALPAVSFGYFDTATEAASIFPGAQEYIRRWTGGGIVDHRIGYTYTVTLPGQSAFSPSRVQGVPFAISKVTWRVRKNFISLQL